MLRGATVGRGAGGRGAAVNRGGPGRAVAVSTPSILDLSPTWAIDARSGPVDLIGDADPSPMASSLVPGDSVTRAVSLKINEVDFAGTPASASFLYSADSSALSITGDIDIRGSMAGFDDLTNNGSVPQKIMVSKFRPSPSFATDWQLSIALDGDPRFTFWPDVEGPVEAVSVSGTEDPYSDAAYRVTRVAATGAVAAYVEDDDNPDVTTADGRHWRSLGTASSTTKDLSDTDNMTLTYMIGKGWGGWCQVYDGIDGDLVVDLDIDRDATPGLATGDTFTAASGETWTLGGQSATFSCDRPAWLVGYTYSADGTFTVADAETLDLGTGDFTIAMVYEPSTLASGAGDFRQLLSKIDPSTLGVGGVGWVIGEYEPLGGVGFAFADGGAPGFAFSGWTAGERHLVVVTGDRDGVLSLYVDDMASAAATVSMVGVGSLSNSRSLISEPPGPALMGAAAVWGRVLSADELASLPALMGA